MTRPIWRQHRNVLKGFLQNLVKHVPPLVADNAVQLERKKLTGKQLAALFASHVDKMTAADRAFKAYLLAVSAEKSSLPGIVDGIKGLQGYSHVMLGGKKSAATVTLGLGVRDRKKPKPATQTLANEKSKATRKARNTLGKKQKAKIKGNVTSAIVTKEGVKPVPEPAR